MSLRTKILFLSFEQTRNNAELSLKKIFQYNNFKSPAIIGLHNFSLYNKMSYTTLT